MREILFRGKRKDNGEWVEGDLMQHYVHHDDLTIVVGGCVYYEVDSETVGQFTGLTDKNGVKVFEGDILYAKYEDTQEEKGYYEVYDEVVFKNGAFGLIGETTGDLLSFDYLPIVNEVVCGNIYDNKELLK